MIVFFYSVSITAVKLDVTTFLAPSFIISSLDFTLLVLCHIKT